MVRHSVRKRIEAFFLRNLGRKVTREEIIKAAKNPVTGEEPENWHQRLSELRTNMGYTILSWRDGRNLKPGEYIMPDAKRRKLASERRAAPDLETWQAVLKRAGEACEWVDGSVRCGLKDGEIDPIGGGTVKLTRDHKTPHSVNAASDPHDPNAWQVLCSRHQVTKKNFGMIQPDGSTCTPLSKRPLKRKRGRSTSS